MTLNKSLCFLCLISQLKHLICDSSGHHTSTFPQDLCCCHLCDCASGGKGGNNTKARLCGEISGELSLKLKRSAVQNETRGSNPITSSLPSLFKAATPSFSAVFVAFILGSKHPDAWAFLSGNNCGHPCLFSPFFTSWSRSQCVIVFAQKDLTYTLVVLVTVYIGGWSSPRITLLCVVKR